MRSVPATLYCGKRRILFLRGRSPLFVILPVTIGSSWPQPFVGTLVTLIYGFIMLFYGPLLPIVVLHLLTHTLFDEWH